MEEGKSSYPERIGRYRIVRPLSKGGMALVYEGRRESLGGVAPRVAIKVILPDYAASSTFRELFINEARLGAAMHHQNLVQILDFDSDGDRYFLVMEYVEGLTLSRLMGLAARHDLEVPMHVVCEVGRQACEGLHYAHQAVDAKGKSLNLIHRDIKPSNLIVTPEAGIKILDFGISQGALRAERHGAVKGTWGYMAPEQATGERIAPNADVFGLGIVLYEMASRRPMFKGRSEDEIRTMLLADHAARLASTLPARYAPLAAVLARALHRDARERYASAAEFGRHLAELLPDPITVRDEMIRFYGQLAALHEEESPRRRVDGASARSSEPHRRPAVGTIDGTGVPEAQRAFIASAIVGTALVVAAFVLGVAIFRLYGQGPAAPSVGAIEVPSRPVPVVPAVEIPAAPASEPPESVVAEPEAAPAAGSADVALDALRDDEGYLSIRSVAGAEMYVDGKLVRDPDTPGVWKSGRHVVTLVHPDGRRVAFVVDLAPGTHEKLEWDFERWDFR